MGTIKDSRSVLLGYAVLDCVVDHVRHGCKVQLLHDARLVRADGLDADVEAVGDLGDVVAGDDQLEYLEFAVGQQGVWRSVADLVERPQRHAFGRFGLMKVPPDATLRIADTSREGALSLHR